ncbi:VPLPA-CTERM sorting domain-containing protein [Rubellimicrobium aerolatum]|uniref:VPLPA-CTERM sorting domain-containing protein n=1 Tax=Rubellimicrobium aerolatum TaxID=490979 RepID=A0ABW0SH88_9RHOB|nr:VPLPA-CTERM sorting domain-containing protein [Rubellimicrobium aerolatum]MBP1806629.1 hypothetical protein [Rubellimicrobium aerolatum]
MIKTLRAAGLAAAFALAPLAAKAITVNASSSVQAGETVEMVQDNAWHWEGTFLTGEGPGTLTYAFHNAGASLRTMDFVFNVRQLSAFFTGGVTITFGDLTYSIAQGSASNPTTWQQGGNTDVTNFLVFDPDETKTLAIAYGVVVNNPTTAASNASTAVTFDAITPGYSAPTLPPVAAVPVPAAGLMLVSALGGLGLMRRRRTA